MLEHNYSKFEPIETERLIIRPLSIDDLLPLHRIRSDKNINRYIERENEIDIKETKEFIQKIKELTENNTCIYWAIIFRNYNLLIGTICFWNFNFNIEEAEIGYELLPEFQGKGIMLEATNGVIDFGFEILKLKSISAFVSEKNIKSIALLEKFHFKIFPNNLSDKSEVGKLKEMIRFKLEEENYRRNFKIA